MLVTERARAPRHFILGKGHPIRKFKISIAEHFKGTKAMAKSMEAIAFVA